MDQSAVWMADCWYHGLGLMQHVGCMGFLHCFFNFWSTKSTHQGCTAVLLAAASLLWQRMQSEVLRLRFTPNIRSFCKSSAERGLRQMQESHNVRVFDGFTQQAVRFLFEPNDKLWQCTKRIEVQTILPNGSMETRSWFRPGKGIFSFVRAADLQGPSLEGPYSFLRDDHSRAVVQMWTKTVDQNLKSHFEMLQITHAADLSDEGERMAYIDFEQALMNLLGSEAVQQGKISRCAERAASLNNHLALEGRLEDVVNVLKQNSCIAHHYFRCFVSEDGRPGILANLGFGKGHLPFHPGPSDTRIVLYIRQGNKQHACVQAFEAFVLDNRRPSQPFTELVGDFGRLSLQEPPLGQGQSGVVYKVVPLSGKYRQKTKTFALKLAKMRRHQQDLEKELRISQTLQHQLFMTIYESGEMWLPNAHLEGWRGVLMDLAETNLEAEVLKASDSEGKALDTEWLRRCRPLMAQMVYAVSYLHQHRIVHRDLKPENVLLDRVASDAPDMVRLTDFGLAVEDFDGTPMKGFCGTPAYAAPEMMQKPPEYGIKCDVYSLAATFHAILRRCKGMNKQGVDGLKLKDPVHLCNYPEQLEHLLKPMLWWEMDRPTIDEVQQDLFFRSFQWGADFEMVDWVDWNKMMM